MLYRFSYHAGPKTSWASPPPKKQSNIYLNSISETQRPSWYATLTWVIFEVKTLTNNVCVCENNNILTFSHEKCFLNWLHSPLMQQHISNCAFSTMAAYHGAPNWKERKLVLISSLEVTTGGSMLAGTVPRVDCFTNGLRPTPLHGWVPTTQYAAVQCRSMDLAT